MALIIDKTEISQPQQFSDKIQTLLQLIHQGMPCTEALIKQKQIVKCNSEEQFIEMLCLKLMGSTLLYLHQLHLSVGTGKLFELHNQDLRTLAVLNSHNSEKERIILSEILTKYHLVDSNALNKIARFYHRYNLDYPAINSGASFDEKLTLYNVICYCEQAFTLSEETVTTAYHWATQKAQNLGDFARYFCLYLVWENSQLKTLTSPDHLIETLAPIVNSNLNHPIAIYELDVITLQQMIKSWYQDGNNLGFSGFTSGLLSIVLNIDLNSEDVVKDASAYLDALQTTLRSTSCNACYMSQSGLSRHYSFNSQHGEVILKLDRQGYLSLFSHWPSTSIFNLHL